MCHVHVIEKVIDGKNNGILYSILTKQVIINDKRRDILITKSILVLSNYFVIVDVSVFWTFEFSKRNETY